MRRTETKDTAYAEPLKTDLPSGIWIVNDRGEASPYIPWYVDASGFARPMPGWE